MAILTIAHVITDLQMGGAERMLARLVTGADPNRIRHVVLTLTGGGPFHDQIQAAGIRVHDLGMRRGRPSLMAVVRAAWVLRHVRPDVVQTWLYHADALGSLAAWLAGYRTLCWNIRCSDMDLSRYGRMTRWVVRALAALSGFPRLILSNSQAGIRAHQELGYHARRWGLIPNGVELDQYRPDPEARQQWRHQLGLAEDSVLFLMVARRDPMKDHDSFLRAARQVAQRCPQAVFVLAGRGVDQDKELKQLAEEVAAPVYLLGQIHPIQSLMAAADVGVLMSRFGEGFPNVLAESMACGLPCIASDVGDAALVIDRTGQIIAPGDQQALVNAMIHWADSPHVRQAMGQAARRRVEQHYDIHTIIGQYERLWRDLAEQERVG